MPVDIFAITITNLLLEKKHTLAFFLKFIKQVGNSSSFSLVTLVHISQGLAFSQSLQLTQTQSKEKQYQKLFIMAEWLEMRLNSGALAYLPRGPQSPPQEPPAPQERKGPGAQDTLYSTDSVGTRVLFCFDLLFVFLIHNKTLPPNHTTEWPFQRFLYCTPCIHTPLPFL